MGGRQTRRAASRRAMLDTRLPRRAEGSFRALSALLLDHLELLQEQGSCQELAGGVVEAGCDRKDGDGERRLRSAGVREADDVEGVAGTRAAEGHALSLPEPLQ